MSIKYLYGSEVDLYTEGMNKMLKVTNPGAKASCGCGTSFALMKIYWICIDESNIAAIFRAAWVTTHMVAYFFIIAYNGVKLGWF